ncbi:MAG TPA: flagellar hook-associated protein FlgK [Gemmatimonas aurantiaca]|uniref:Flagellar hook-associated protein 1 n=2 Tax=Gemmatimonas aurantiaca TaxID=173480 RepID=C1A531_GEMAT|nr:flagellar hook-associated protein FlgK [Gemmatimonas aurantiaca]BAH37341.1 flagellar hook-associated protein 1 [Gemmatimonas aurantiaca T-27]HCT55757.1 flagellar hook-associated protein FlgK [Gemmatimonas aurantiaca]
MGSGLFSIARSALLSHQTALQTISHNVANAETPGFSRQEAVLAANTPVRLYNGNVGTGVHVATIQRKRDLLLDDNYRSANVLAGNSTMRRDLMQKVEDVFGEPSETGMSNALDQFWNSWSDLSAQPNSLAARAVVQQRGRQLGQLFNDYDTQLTQQRTSNLELLDNTVGRINALASQVAELNTRILASEGNGHVANDLRDMRDLRLDELANVAGTRVVNQPNGTVTVVIGNSTLVEGDTWNKVSAQLEPPVPTPAVPLTDVPVKIRLGDSPDRLAPLDGQLSAIVKVLNEDIPATRGRLDAMASQIVTAVNTAHTAGYVFSGNTVPGTAAGNFFEAGTVTNPVRASNIKLDNAISADPGKIAASNDANGPTSNGTAQALAALRIADGTVTWTAPNGTTESGSFVGFFRGLVTRLGVDTASANDSAAVAENLVQQAEIRRQSVSGVNTDEELVNMLRVQQSYQAAAKMITAADEMLKTLINLV